MKTFKVTLTGKTPLLMHHDNLDWSDHMSEWQADPNNKKLSKAGDDRTPPFRWLGNCYHDGQVLGIPSENIMRCAMEAGAMVPVPGGKGGKTFKAQTQSGMMSENQFWPITAHGNPIKWAPVEQLKDEPVFTKHKTAAQKLGFDLLVKRAKIGTSKHIRVRPIFAEWELRGGIVVWDEQITRDILQSIFTFGGQYKGLGSWRPGGRTPGPYGTFQARISE